VRLSGSARLLQRFTPASLKRRQIVRHCVSDGQRTESSVMSFLSPSLGAPPCSRGLLGLPVVVDSNAVSVLQVVCDTDPMLGVAASLIAPSRKPGATVGPPSISEREPLLEAAPVRLGTDWEPQPSGAGFEFCIADRSGHFPPIPIFGEFLGSIRRRKPVYHSGQWRQVISPEWAQVAFVEIRRGARIDPLTAKTGFESPRERQLFHVVSKFLSQRRLTLEAARVLKGQPGRWELGKATISSRVESAPIG
jgi:hypothetical protein